MREREMRQRVERFLQSRLRNMLLPATLGLGLGLAVGACDSDALDASDGGGQTAKQDSASADKQAAPDSQLTGQSDAGTAVAMYMAQLSDASAALPDTGLAVRYMAQMPADAAPDLGRNVAIYMAQLPVPRS
jgi:hypothetical protein